MSAQFRDYYQTLGVSKTATPAEIKSAFRKLARQTTDFDDRTLAAIGQYDRHLQQDLERVSNAIGVKMFKAFSAVPALQ